MTEILCAILAVVFVGLCFIDAAWQASKLPKEPVKRISPRDSWHKDWR